MPDRHVPTRPTLLLLVLLGIAACQSGSGGDMAEPAYGSASCSACGKVIDDPRFAAQYRLADGAVKSFDDPACLFEALRAEPAAPEAIRFHAFEGSAWLSPADGWFSRSPATAGHGSGWAAYPSFAAAQDAVAAGGSGEILSFDQAKAAVQRKQ